MKLLKHEPLSNHTSFKIGGEAEVIAFPETIEELKSLAKKAKHVMGAGSNILAPDAGVKGLVVKLTKLDKIEVKKITIKAQTGALLSKLVGVSIKEGLTGLEWAAGIPGTIGGAVVMNAGAFGLSISDAVKEVVVLTRNGKTKKLKPKDLKFGYRSSILQKKNWIVVEVTLKLRKGAGVGMGKGKVREYLKKRREKQPLNYPSAGSVFKNPAGGACGRLIEAAGCKGMRIGDVMVSQKHANFIVNLGNAKAADVLALIKKIKKRVKVRIEEEIKVWYS